LRYGDGPGVAGAAVCGVVVVQGLIHIPVGHALASLTMSFVLTTWKIPAL
jgi:urea transporter